MKNKYSIIGLLIAIGVCFHTVYATQRHVPSVYPTVTAAVAAATNGDSIIVASAFIQEPAIVTVNKSLTILGQGFRDTLNGGTWISKGFWLTGSADNTLIRGFRFLQPVHADSPFVYIASGCSGVVVERNYFDSYLMYMWAVYAADGSQNIRISGNIMDTCAVFVGTASNVTIANNVIIWGRTRTQPGNGFGIFVIGGTRVHIFNNMIGQIVSSQASYGACMYFETTTDLLNTYIYGNVFYRSPYIVNQAQNAGIFCHNWLYNITGNMQPPNGFNNYEGDPGFTRFVLASGFIYKDDPSMDSDLRLTSSSGCIDAGFSNITPAQPFYTDKTGQGGLGTSQADIGIFGGPYPAWSPFSAPTIPSVTSVQVVPDQVSPSGSFILNVTGSIGATDMKKNASMNKEQ